MSYCSVSFGAVHGGLASVGYTLRDAAGVLGSRITAGVAEVVAGSGLYAADVDGSSGPTGILWDTGEGGSTVYATEDFDRTRFATGIPLSDIAEAVRDVNNASPAADSLGAAVNDAGGAGLSASDVWAAGTRTLTAGTNLGTVNATLVSTGLDAIPTTLNVAPTTWPQWMLWKTLRFRRTRKDKTTGAISVYGTDGSTVITTQTSTDTTGEQTTGVPS